MTPIISHPSSCTEGETTPYMGSHVLVDVSCNAVASQPGLECSATGEASICTQKVMAAAKREQYKRNTYQNGISGRHRFVHLTAEALSSAIRSEAVVWVKMLGRIMKQRQERKLSLCVREIYKRLACGIQQGCNNAGSPG